MAYPKLTPITATGATAPRYLGDRFSDIVNVKDFGAKGDGVADDTTAFTAAQNSGAQAVMVPNGTYKITEDVAGTFFSFGKITTTGGGNVEIIDVLALDSVPTGTVLWLSASTVPAGYLLCNGSAVGRATYPELFAAIGTTYGAGDGSTTFNLPNLIDKFAEGGTVAGTVKAAGLPNVSGSFIAQGLGHPYSVGSVSDPNAVNQLFTVLSIGYVDSGSSQTNDYQTSLLMDLSKANSIYGNSDTVQPPALTLLPCIKAFSSVVGDATVVAGQLVNDIESKVALDGSNLSSAAFKVIVETWHSGTEWYRIWSDGWIEQGGYRISSGNQTLGTLTFHKPFTTTDYYFNRSAVFTRKDGEQDAYYTGIWSGTKTVTSIQMYDASGYASGYNWYACGF